MASTRDIKAGRAYVELATKNQLDKGLQAAQAKLKAFGQSVTAIGASIGAMGAAITGPIGAAVGVFSKVGDEINKAATRTGVAVEALSALKYAAEQSGAGLEELESGLRKMANVITDARSGSDSAAASLAALGLSVQQVQGLKPDEQFRLIAEQLSKVSDATTRAAIAQDIFGKGGTQLIPLMADGAKGIKALEDRARELGLTMSGEAANAATKFGDNLADVWAQVQRMTAEVGFAIAKALDPYWDSIQRTAAATIAWLAKNHEIIVTIGKIGVGLLGLGAGLVVIGQMTTAISGMTVAIKAMNVAITVLSKHPLVALISVLGIATTAIIAYTTQADAVEDVTNKITDATKKQNDEIERGTGAINARHAAHMRELEAYDKEMAAVQALGQEWDSLRSRLDDLRTDSERSLLGEEDQEIGRLNDEREKQIGLVKELIRVAKELSNDRGVADLLDELNRITAVFDTKVQQVRQRFAEQRQEQFNDMAELSQSLAFGVLGLNAQIQRGVESAQTGMTSRGTFNAAAIQGLEGGVSEQQLAEAKLHTKYLKDISRKNAGLVII